MMKPKGKAATKGQKQILEENKQTIQFYTVMSACAGGIYFVLMLMVFPEQFTTRYWILSIFSSFLYVACLGTMHYMAKPGYNQTGGLIDGGIDLNMEAGFAEHLKDLVILTAVVQALALVSNYFWFLWLFAPFRAVYMLWTNILAPWFFAPAPEPEEEVSDKKRLKMERQQKRMSKFQ
ncbi:Transmembrane protein [Halotydeus destructor]|nr:Transmembrane protein [Halotydeus destructor]